MKKVLAVLLLLSGASAAYGEIYTWRDTRGTLFYTNSLHEIPARYLKKARVLDVATGKKGGLATEQPVGQTAPATLPRQTPATYPVATSPSPVPSAVTPEIARPVPSAATPEIAPTVPSSASPAAVVARPQLPSREARGQSRKERRRMRSQTEEE